MPKITYMLQIHYIRENREETIKRLEKKYVKDAETTVNKIIELDEARRKLQNELDANFAEANNLATQIGDLFKAGKAQEANVLKAKTKLSNKLEIMDIARERQL